MSERPNIIFIITDQQRFDAMSAAGNTVLSTPNMDKIAADGVMFEKAYTPVPVCGPTRTCLLTGQNIDNTGIPSNGEVYDPDLFVGGPSYDMLLSDAGYRTAYYGKWHSPQELAQQYENDGEYNVTATSESAGLGTSMGKHYRNFLDDATYTEVDAADEFDLNRDN